MKSPDPWAINVCVVFGTSKICVSEHACRHGSVHFISFQHENRIKDGETVLQQNLKLLNPQF